MSSPPKKSEDGSELKAGHPPAVKVGGMRVTQHRQPAAPVEKPTPEDEEEFGSGEPKPDLHGQKIVVSGAVTKGDRDFPPEAVKQYHNKPLPAKDIRPIKVSHNIQQPR